MIRIAIDAMGGDHAPAEIVKGAVQASLELPIELILVGKADKISKELSKYKKKGSLSVVHAEEVITNNEAPVSAVKQKKNSSLNLAVALVKNKEAVALVSAGNTGALMAASLFGLGRIPGIERPAIAGFFPTKKRPVLMLDIGANSDCKPKQLMQFAEMGAQFVEYVLHVKAPRVGLLNIGEEREKGNTLTTEAWPLLKSAPINFVGNVEPKEVFSGELDVVVSDGFVGNLALKFGESVSGFLFDLIKKELTKNPITYFAAFLLLPAFAGIKKKTDYDEYGGAPMLGINGIVIKAHGRAKAKAIKNAVRAAYEAHNQDIVGRISKLEKEQ